MHESYLQGPPPVLLGSLSHLLEYKGGGGGVHHSFGDGQGCDRRQAGTAGSQKIVGILHLVMLAVPVASENTATLEKGPVDAAQLHDGNQ